MIAVNEIKQDKTAESDNDTKNERYGTDSKKQVDRGAATLYNIVVGRRNFAGTEGAQGD